MVEQLGHILLPDSGEDGGAERMEKVARKSKVFNLPETGIILQGEFLQH